MDLLSIYKRHVIDDFVVVIVCLFLSGCSAATPVKAVKPAPSLPPESVTPKEYTETKGPHQSARDFKPEEYWPPSICRDCHDKIFEQHSQSMHEKSFINPVFQKIYFGNLLPRAIKISGLSREAESCIACHAPLSYIKTKGRIISEEQVDPRMSGVTCDLCHTISGYEGKSPGNGNYISKPGSQKLGPFRRESSWHHVYSELQTKSEFCGICHNRVNHNGLEIISTFTEWKDSRYAAEGIQCQNCHMNIQGFLTAGKPVYETGKAAHMTVGYAPYRNELYTHRFPGAHSRTEVAGALTTDIEIEEPFAVPGEEITIHLSVDNSRSGHKMPSGSAELRMLYIDFYARIGNKVFPIPASPRTTNMHDVTGKGKFDRKILGDSIPEGKRIYRAICVDKEGEQTLFSFDASKIVFDNRLNAAEIRKETYKFTVPEDAEDTLSLIAKLFYLRYPDSFAALFGLPEAETVEIASAGKTMLIKKRHSR